MAECSQWGDRAHPRQLMMHREVREQRLLSCPYCEMQVEAHNLEIHMEGCDHRPASCPHCNAEYDTFIDLRDNHMDVCLRNPQRRHYQSIQRDVQEPNTTLEDVWYSAASVSQPIDRILKLEAMVLDLKKDNADLRKTVRNLDDSQVFPRKVQEALNSSTHISQLVAHAERLEQEVQELRKENASLKEKVRNIDDAQKTQDYLRTHMADVLEKGREQVNELQKDNAALRQQLREIEDSQKREEFMRINMADRLEELQEQTSELKATIMQNTNEEDATA